MFKQGVVYVSDLMHPKIKESLPILDSIFQEEMQRDVIITSAMDQVDDVQGTYIHGKFSLHPDGAALDLRSYDVPADVQEVITDRLRDELDEGFDVILESNHWHIEYDPAKHDRTHVPHY